MNTVRPTASIVVADTDPVGDDRGSFARLFCARELKNVLGDRQVVQINQSVTRRVGAVRGLHYQRPPHAEMKFIRCLRGRVWDVAVDLREGSPTFLKWTAEELSGNNRRMLCLPEGCAHGFQVLEPESELLYLHTAYYEPMSEGGVHVDDPRLAIAWPLPIEELSARDSSHAFLNADFTGIAV